MATAVIPNSLLIVQQKAIRSETSPPTVPATSEPKPKQSRSAQDKIIGAYIAAAKKFLKVASDDEQIRPSLEAHGYPA